MYVFNPPHSAESSSLKTAATATATPTSHRRFSARDFLDGAEASEEASPNDSHWQMVLSAASADDFDSTKSERQDVLLLGHHDG